jgi:single-strand DNA-binding protein
MPLLADNIADDPITDTAATPDQPLSVNVVHLVGKLSKPVQTMDLPSGDRLARWALVITRPQPDSVADSRDSADATADVATTRRRQHHDTIDCVTFDQKLLEYLTDVPAGARLEVHGALRRRFRSGEDGRLSSYSVEALTVDVRSTPPPPEPVAPVDPEADVTEPVTAAG